MGGVIDIDDTAPVALSHWPFKMSFSQLAGLCVKYQDVESGQGWCHWVVSNRISEA